MFFQNDTTASHDPITLIRSVFNYYLLYGKTVVHQQEMTPLDISKQLNITTLDLEHFTGILRDHKMIRAEVPLGTVKIQILETNLPDNVTLQQWLTTTIASQRPMIGSINATPPQPPMMPPADLKSLQRVQRQSTKPNSDAKPRQKRTSKHMPAAAPIDLKDNFFLYTPAYVAAQTTKKSKAKPRGLVETRPIARANAPVTLTNKNEATATAKAPNRLIKK